MSQEIDAEIISEQKLPERPREQRTISLPQSATNAAVNVANGLDSIGATEAASKVRAGMAAGVAVGQTIEGLKPAFKAVGEFVQDLKDKGYIKMAPRRRAFSPRKKVSK